MATRAYETVRECHAPLFERFPLPWIARETFPWPPIRKIGEAKREIRVLVIENDDLRVEASTDCGGRFYSIWDKRHDREVLNDASPFAGGIELFPQGIRFPTDAFIWGTIQQVSDEDSSPSVILCGIDWFSGLSWQLSAQMNPREASVVIGVQVFNRKLLPSYARPCVFIGGQKPKAVEGGAAFDYEHGVVGVALHEGMTAASRLEDTLVIHRPVGRRGDLWLYPHKTESFAFSLTPYPGIESISGLSAKGFVKVNPSEILVGVTEAVVGGKLVLQLYDDRSVETSVNVSPGSPVGLSLSGLGAPPVAALLRHSNHDEVFRLKISHSMSDLPAWDTDFVYPAWEPANDALLVESAYLEGFDSFVLSDSKSAEEHFMIACSSPALDSAAWLCLALLAMRGGDWNKAISRLDETLMRNGNDPLAWWLRSWAERQTGSDGSDSLTTAHLLWPLEPVLRADAFLSSVGESAASDLLGNFGDDSQVFREVAMLLWECGRLADLNTWLDESKNQTNDPMIGVIHSFAFLQLSGRELAAKEQLDLSPSGFAVPLRDYEVAMVRRVREVFPENFLANTALSIAFARAGVFHSSGDVRLDHWLQFCLSRGLGNASELRDAALAFEKEFGDSWVDDWFSLS